MAKGDKATETTQEAPLEEALAFGVWADEVGLDPVRRALMSALYGGRKLTREGWRALLEETLQRPAK